ncbi:methyltransferase domain-containing protein [Gelidibacter salicanalis]|uniref:Methyltransferase domain-containing protein n=1 Tax=Gelidibacter salicanalis TaxID=291193 RepID=A0A934KHB2_9FLAO|nr:methyltransferase domain-containing protein [Gelidibacter salicanalis]MBJ7879531.1 methyltransferase domain-containing protein [Gelidibacter salicanalis]
MSFLIDTRHRTEAEEIMDDFSIHGPVLNDTLNKLATINKFLGGNAVTINGLKILLKDQPKTQPITIIDLGCGGGDMLRAIAKYAKTEGYRFQLIGIDANKNTTDYAKTISAEYENIEFLNIDVFSERFKTLHYDIVISTLFLHHFKEHELLQLLRHLFKIATIGIVVNDLHRHRLAFYLFKLITIPVNNKMIIEDGLTSVLRGFKRKELVELSSQLNSKYQLKWKWAFRYQWVLRRFEV